MTTKRFTKFIAISLCFHLILVGTLALIDRLDPLTNKDQRVEVELITSPTQTVTNKKSKAIKIDTQQVVDQDKEFLNQETPENTKFLSQHSQTVKKETASKNRGEFKNVKNKAALHPLAQNPMPSGATKSFDPLSEMNERFKQKQMQNIGKNPEDRPQAKPNGGDVSQSQDYLKNIDPGLETLLNTKEFKYYTYFNRIRRQLSQYWEPKVREKLSTMFRQGRSIASDQDKVTKLLIFLSPTGQLVKVQILSDSGVKDLDEAAIEAFRMAAPFPNPPKGIVDPDGTVKIRWDFILES
ncbi:MAG: energy transducer TonB [Bdellovibrionota bacterium]